jgi:hypothetical protein
MTTKRIKEIAGQLLALSNELATLVGDEGASRTKIAPKKELAINKSKSGATGGLRTLIDEGRLDTPKQRSEIIELLKQDGRHYSRETISMGLLNLVRERVLTRIRAKTSKKWEFVKRK